MKACAVIEEPDAAELQLFDDLTIGARAAQQSTLEYCYLNNVKIDTRLANLFAINIVYYFEQAGQGGSSEADSDYWQSIDASTFYLEEIWKGRSHHQAIPLENIIFDTRKLAAFATREQETVGYENVGFIFQTISAKFQASGNTRPALEVLKATEKITLKRVEEFLHELINKAN